MIEKWKQPAYALFEKSKQKLSSHLKRIVDRQATQDSLKQAIWFVLSRHSLLILSWVYAHRRVVDAHISARAKETVERIDFLMKLETQPYTRNNHYFTDSRNKFYSFYKGLLDPGKNNNFLQNLEDMKQKKNLVAFQGSLSKTLSGLAEMGFSNVDSTSLTRLQEPDPMEAAIEIMADVRAYFQGMYI
jgi:hypothetical protein